jgi:hypothetical protein
MDSTKNILHILFRQASKNVRLPSPAAEYQAFFVVFLLFYILSFSILHSSNVQCFIATPDQCFSVTGTHSFEVKRLDLEAKR